MPNQENQFEGISVIGWIALPLLICGIWKSAEIILHVVRLIKSAIGI